MEEAFVGIDGLPPPIVLEQVLGLQRIKLERKDANRGLDIHNIVILIIPDYFDRNPVYSQRNGQKEILTKWK
jgi:hypothetical protein